MALSTLSLIKRSTIST